MCQHGVPKDPSDLPAPVYSAHIIIVTSGSSSVVWLLVTLAALWVQNTGLLALDSVAIHIIYSYTNYIMAFYIYVVYVQPAVAKALHFICWRP